LFFDLNANPERAAFQIAEPGMMNPKGDNTPSGAPVPVCLDWIEGDGKQAERESVSLVLP